MNTRRCLFVVACLLVGLVLPWGAIAQTEVQTPLTVWEDAAGVHIRWQSTDARAAISAWPLTEVAGAKLPAHLVAIRPQADITIVPAIAGLRAAALGPTTNALPQAPVVVARQGRIRGTAVVVLAVLPLHGADGEQRLASSFEALVPGASLLAQSAAELLASEEPFLQGVSGPTNSALTVRSLRLTVTKPGIYRVVGAALAEAGFNLPTLNPDRIQLWRNGATIPLELRGMGDNKVDPTDEFRFYAGVVGDRWNTSDTYWLTVDRVPGARMTNRALQAGTAPVQTTAFEAGQMTGAGLYVSHYPGVDGDHWFAANLVTQADLPTDKLSLPWASRLPALAGTAVVTVTGYAESVNAHHLEAQIGTATQLKTWQGRGNFTWSYSLAASPATTLTLALRSFNTSPIIGQTYDRVLPDVVAWLRPVSLDVRNKGAEWVGMAGTWRYQLANVPANSTIYDITHPTAPQLGGAVAAGTAQIQDGPTARRYVVVPDNEVLTPVIQGRDPVDLAVPASGNVLYLVPRALQPALQPLVQFRQGQGYSTRVIAVEDVYDGWSYGQVSARALRNFLRYTASVAQPVPGSVVIVGDGTLDPLNNTGFNNPNLVPPFMADDIDVVQNEAACEFCYAQLDGDDPITSPDADLLPDLSLGRLPVHNAEELSALVTKIVGYETAPPTGLWRSRNLYFTDNYRQTSGAPDPAGNFWQYADESIKMQPQGALIDRLYFDPWQRDADGNPLRDPWRIGTAQAAHERTKALLNAGAGLVNYVGHGNHYQWAVTDLNAQSSYLLHFYDVGELRNADKLPIVIEMTCLTGAFAQPDIYPTTLDEALLLNPNGGSIASWAPTGASVAVGHDALQRGFYKALWSAPPMTSRLGTLAAAGYLELFATGCCPNTMHTYMLIGDPLTTARVAPAQQTYLPAVNR